MNVLNLTSVHLIIKSKEYGCHHLFQKIDFVGFPFNEFGQSGCDINHDESLSLNSKETFNCNSNMETIDEMYLHHLLLYCHQHCSLVSCIIGATSDAVFVQRLFDPGVPAKYCSSRNNILAKCKEEAELLKEEVRTKAAKES